MVWLVTDLLDMVSTFGTVVATDPVAALLILVSVVILGITFGVTGVLAAGAITNTITGWP